MASFPAVWYRGEIESAQYKKKLSEIWTKIKNMLTHYSVAQAGFEKWKNWSKISLLLSL